MLEKFVQLSSQNDPLILNLVNTYHGKVNASDWKGFPAHSVLLANIGTSVAGNTLLRKVRFSFIWKPQLWFSWSQFNHAAAGTNGEKSIKNLANPDQSNGWKRFQTQQEADFNDLGL